MSDVIENLKSPSWWASVVIATFLVNLLSAYAKPRLDVILSFLSASWRRRVGEAAARRQATIERIRASGNLQVLLMLDEIRSMLVMIIGYAGTVGFVALAVHYATGWEALLLAVVAVLPLLAAILSQSRATDISSALRDAGVTPWQSLKDAEPSSNVTGQPN
jgi:tetrahydromethanopterin S-methyltransferase subunit E